MSLVKEEKIKFSSLFIYPKKKHVESENIKYSMKLYVRNICQSESNLI